MDELIFADNELNCPECGSPEKNETDIENYRDSSGKITKKIHHLNCTKCGKMWFVIVKED
jgi:transcription elongation factor Elf1